MVHEEAAQYVPHKNINSYIHHDAIIGMIANEHAEALLDMAEIADINAILAEDEVDLPARYEMACDKPLDWDETPTIVQACHPYLLHAIEITQEVVHAGYQQGPTLGTTTLLPCQEKQIATVTWKRGEKNSRSESIVARDELSSSLARSRDIEDLHTATANEASRGGSKSQTGSVSAGVSIPLPGVVIGVSGSLSKANSSSFQNSSRRMAAQTSQKLRDSTQQAAQSIRSQTVTVVHEVSQEESVSAVTEVIKNHNKSRSMHLVTSEILAAYDVGQRITNVQEVIAVPLRISMFTEAKVLRWRNALENALQKRELFPGFSSIERIHNSYVGAHMPSGSYADAGMTHVDGTLVVECRIAAPDPEKFPDISHFPRFMQNNYYFKRNLFNSWKAHNANKERYWIEKVAPRFASELVKRIRVNAVVENDVRIPLKLEPTALTKLNRRGAITVAFNPEETIPDIARSRIRYLEFVLVDGSETPTTLDTLLTNGSELVIQSGSFRYETPFSTSYLLRNGRIRNDLSGQDTVFVRTPIHAHEKVNPVKKDEHYRNLLLQELNTNLVTYHEALYHHMAMENPSQLRMMMDGVIVPESGGKSVRTVMGEYIGAFDGCVAFYIAPGYDLTKKRVNELLGEDVDLDDENFNLMSIYAEDEEPESLRITMPTGTTFSEASLGECILSEKIDYSLNVNWLEPCDNATTAIDPVSTDSRRSEPTDLTAKDLSQPIINLQNAPAAPDYKGSDALLTAISNPNTFRDMTGLAGTQANNMQAYLATQAGADKARDGAVEMAVAKMAEKEQNMQNIDRLGSRLDEAVESGRMSKWDAQNIYKKQFENTLDKPKSTGDTGKGDFKLIANFVDEIKGLSSDKKISKILDFIDEDTDALDVINQLKGLI